MPFVPSPRARADLDAIWDYMAERWGREQAERYVRQIQAALEALADNPGLGAATPGTSAPATGATPAGRT